MGLTPCNSRCRAPKRCGPSSSEVQVEVEEVFALEQVASAHTRGESDRTRGKLVLSLTP